MDYLVQFVNKGGKVDTFDTTLLIFKIRDPKNNYSLHPSSFMQSDSLLKGLGYGAFASMLGDLVTMPVDVTKTRMQLQGTERIYKNAIDCMVQTAKGEGITALWKGLEPALWRQASYGSLRYGLYSPIKDMLAPGVAKKDLSIGYKILAGGLSGTVAQMLANPCDLVKVRMMGFKSAPPVEYRWFLTALAQIIKTEGLGGLYRGVGANMGRASTLAAAEMASYDSIKPWMREKYQFEEGLPLHASTAMCSGFIAAFVANPFDVCKSRVMRDDVGKYLGMIDCFKQTFQKEGITSFWKGFIPAWARVGPRVVICFVVMEQLRIKFG